MRDRRIVRELVDDMVDAEQQRLDHQRAEAASIRARRTIAEMDAADRARLEARRAERAPGHVRRGGLGAAEHRPPGRPLTGLGTGIG